MIKITTNTKFGRDAEYVPHVRVGPSEDKAKVLVAARR